MIKGNGMKTILIIIAVLLILVCGTAWFMGGFTMGGRRQTLEEALAWQSSHYDTSFITECEKMDYTVSGSEGYELHVQLLKNPVPSDDYVIISHGYTDNRIGALKYAGMYLDLGYNCVIWDLRGHGLNEKAFTTYGILEARDLVLLIEDTGSRYPGLRRLGLHGESLGAATTVTALKYRPEVDFAVADCGFSDIENVLRGAYRNYHVPGFFFDLADIGAKVRGGYALTEMRPIDSLDENRIPVLFIHGADDDFILPENSRRMYERAQGKKAFRLIEGAGHAESILTDPESYREYVKDFLRQIG